MPYLNETVGDLAELVDNCPAPETVAVALYRGSKLVLINRSATPYDDQANLIIHEKIGEVFAQV